MCFFLKWRILFLKNKIIPENENLSDGSIIPDLATLTQPRSEEQYFRLSNLLEEKKTPLTTRYYPYGWQSSLNRLILRNFNTLEIERVFKMKVNKLD